MAVGGCGSGGYPDGLLPNGVTDKSKNQLISATKSLINLASTLVGQHVNDVEYKRRRDVCKTCMAIDSNGERLYRLDKAGRPTCGVMRLNKIIRDESKEGCGCYLEQKWKGVTQHCPLNPPKW